MNVYRCVHQEQMEDKEFPEKSAILMKGSIGEAVSRFRT